MATGQDYGDFGGPLLFTMPEQPADIRTPVHRPVHSPLRESGTISSARRSVTPPGSVHMDTTPPQPPPIARLQDTIMSDVEPASGGPSPAAPSQTPGDQPPAAAAAAAQAGAGVGSSLARAEQQAQAEDSWVTVYGFSPDDLPLVLQEFQRCGDILQWGTFGSSPQSNFTHIQYQNKYGAQRALLMSGRQLSSSLIIGVKALDPQHRALVAAWTSGSDGSPGPRVRAAAGPARPYKVELPATQVLPRRATWSQKVSEFVFGL